MEGRRWLQADRDALHARLEGTAFATLPVAIINFLLADTATMAGRHGSAPRFPETRQIVDENGRVMSGDSANAQVPSQLDHPGDWAVLALDGYWVPQELLHTFHPSAQESGWPTRQRADGGVESLFVVHPKSRDTFAPLIDRLGGVAPMAIQGLALGSYRSMLLALPGTTPDGQVEAQFHFAKLSLDTEINGSSRLIPAHECMISAALGSVLAERLSGVQGMRVITDPLALLPAAELTHAARGAGMIVRNPGLTPERLPVPMYALYGAGNTGLLDEMAEVQGITPLQLVEQQIVAPLAKLWVELLFFRNVSLEAHGQNLMLDIDDGFKPAGFVYRDMGGVNALIPAALRATLPEQDQPGLSWYAATHITDAADVAEDYIADRVLFELDKHFIKRYPALPGFSGWRAQMAADGHLGNWTTGSAGDDAHQTQLGLQEFRRYGYFAQQFGVRVLEEMERRGIFAQVAEAMAQVSEGRGVAEKMPLLSRFGLNDESWQMPETVPDAAGLLARLTGPGPAGLSPSITEKWFQQLVLQTYPFFMLARHGELLEDPGFALSPRAPAL